MDVIRVINVEKKFEHHLALDNVSLNIPYGSIFGLLGPNGAGKTTLIRIITQITAADKGEVYINNEKINSKHISIMGYLPEERGLYKKMKVGEQALYLSRLKGISRNDALKELKKWFEKFEIQTWWDKKVEELSKGMQQKVQFIITVLHKPKILIFDEPFSGFDPVNTNLLKQEILNLKKEGASIIFSTHNMASVEEICDNIALINKSKKIVSGDINTIRKQYASDIYEIKYDGYFNKLESTLSSNYKILNLQESNNESILKLEILNSSMTSNELILQMSQFGNISSFNKHLPSMNDIFIKLVTGTNTDTSTTISEQL